MDTLKDIEKLKQAIEKKAGRTMRSPVDFDRLSYLIHENIREQISPSTLKRLWGYVSSSLTCPGIRLYPPWLVT